MASLERRQTLLPASFEPLQLPLDDEGYVVSFRHGEATRAAMRAFMDKYGVLVVRDVLQGDEVDATLDEVWRCLEHARQPRGATTRVSRNDMATWDEGSWPELASTTNGMVCRKPQFTPQFVRNRCSARVAAPFATLYDCKMSELLASADRSTLFRATVPRADSSSACQPHVAATWRTRLHNLHMDINPVDMLFMESRVLAARQDTDYTTTMHLVTDAHNAVASECDGLSLQGILNLVDNRSSHGGTLWSRMDAASEAAGAKDGERKHDGSSGGWQHGEVPPSARRRPGTSREDGGFVCVPGFHKVFSEWVVDTQLGGSGGFGEEFLGGAAWHSTKSSRHNAKKRHSVFWLSGTPVGDELQPLAQRVSCRPGSLILFDSRLPHGSRPNHSSTIRAAQFVTFVPLSRIPRTRRLARARLVRKWIIIEAPELLRPRHDQRREPRKRKRQEHGSPSATRSKIPRLPAALQRASNSMAVSAPNFEGATCAATATAPAGAACATAAPAVTKAIAPATTKDIASATTKGTTPATTKDTALSTTKDAAPTGSAAAPSTKDTTPTGAAAPTTRDTTSTGAAARPPQNGSAAAVATGGARRVLPDGRRDEEARKRGTRSGTNRQEGVLRSGTVAWRLLFGNELVRT